MRSANGNQLGYLVEEDEGDVYLLYSRAVGDRALVGSGRYTTAM